MNAVIETILSHRSVRKFEDKPLTQEQVETIVRCAQAAATSSFVQAYTIISVRDPDHKRRLAELAGQQDYVAQNGHFFVFCADLYRHQLAGEIENVDVTEAIESTEKFIVAVTDTALAAQNAALAAESMELGLCYIGGIRNRLDAVSELLETPEHVVPLFGMAVGYPAHQPGQKPRLPLHHVNPVDGYPQDREQLKQELKTYNQTISDYYAERTQGARTDRWTRQIADKMQKPARSYMKAFLKGKGFPFK